MARASVVAGTSPPSQEGGGSSRFILSDEQREQELRTHF